MKLTTVLLTILLLSSCAGLHHSIKKSKKHERTTTVVSEQIESDAPSRTEILEPGKKIISIERVEDNAVEKFSQIAQEIQKSPEQSSTVDEEEEPYIEEASVERKKFDKIHWMTLISASIGGPIAAGIGIITFNATVMLWIAIPFLAAALTLAALQIFVYSKKVPIKEQDTKFFRRSLFADIVFITLSLIVGIVLVSFISRI